MSRSLERIGDRWTMLILRDAIAGTTRFNEFRRKLGIATNILKRRLDDLVANGLLERHSLGGLPARHEYILTERGASFSDVLDALRKWETDASALPGPARDARPIDK